MDIVTVMPSDKRERQRANRAAKQRRQASRQRRSRIFRTARNGAIVAIIVVGLGLFFFARGDNTSTTTTTAAAPDTTTNSATTTPVAIPTSYADCREQPTACGGEVPPEATTLSFSEPQVQDLQGDVIATLMTSCGNITIGLDIAQAPNTTNSFVFLARSGFYDGTASHRIIGDFMVQLGDPTATGGGGPGYAVPDELPPAGFLYERGTVAMANSGPDTQGSQFFIMIQDNPNLPPNFTVIGTVVDGFDVLDAIAAIPVAASPSRPSDGASTPIETLYIERVEVAEA